MATVAPSFADRKPRLTASERELVLTVADDEQRWHVVTDSRRAISARLLKAARALGVDVTRTGYGYEFSLPLWAIAVRTKRRVRVASQKGQFASQTPRPQGVQGGLGSRGGP